MNLDKNTPRLLGAAFLFQAITSLISGMILKTALTVPGNIGETMIRIADNAWLMRVNIFGELLTALGVIFLGALLYVALGKQSENLALAALGFYILEAALLAASRIAAFSLLRTSQEYVMAGHPAYLQTIGDLAFGSMNFAYTLLMLPFCFGAILFYYLLYKSAIVPRVLSLWSLVTVSLALAGTLFAISGYEVPFFVYLPYAPFEFIVGVWILFKGINNTSEIKQQLVSTNKTL